MNSKWVIFICGSRFEYLQSYLDGIDREGDRDRTPTLQFSNSFSLQKSAALGMEGMEDSDEDGEGEGEGEGSEDEGGSDGEAGEGSGNEESGEASCFIKAFPIKFVKRYKNCYYNFSDHVGKFRKSIHLLKFIYKITVGKTKFSKNK